MYNRRFFSQRENVLLYHKCKRTRSLKKEKRKARRTQSKREIFMLYLIVSYIAVNSSDELIVTNTTLKCKFDTSKEMIFYLYALI